MSTSELFKRHPNNPILTSADWPYEVNGVFNPQAGSTVSNPFGPAEVVQPMDRPEQDRVAAGQQARYTDPTTGIKAYGRGGTLRMTAPDASLNFQPNFIVLAPVGGSVTNPAVLGFASPAPGATSLRPRPRPSSRPTHCVTAAASPSR